MASSFLDVCRFNPTLGGTTDWTYSSAVTGYQSPSAAGAVNGAIYSYRAESTNLVDWEIGFGAYNSGTGVFSRTTVLFNSLGTTAKISFGAAPQVAIVALAEDLLSFNAAMSLTAAQQQQGRANIGAESCGVVNRLRNSSLTSWFRGSSAIVTTSGGWGAEGIYIVPTGASITAQQIANGLSSPRTFWSQKITGAASVTGLVVRFVIESHDAASLAGKQVTVQIPVLNNTGGTITPTITVKRANTQDATYTNVDVSAVSLQAIANGATGTLAYSWTANASSFNGLSINIDFGNNFSSNAKSIQIGGGFDLRVTPGATTGLISGPEEPEIPTAATDTAWNQRFYETTYNNGVAPATATRVGLISLGVMGDGTNRYAAGVPYRTIKRISPPTVTIYDGAGTSGAASRYLNGAYSDGVVTGGGFVTKDERSFVYDPNSTNTNHLLIHYAADATLIGG